ncbi:hypothetical protein BC830DRAFT_1165316 [Chytriomyces sp. MP71]|nr:hypothetical protein BC830DRAFT_1165316 [Chytriomyces sp. MP71]
MTNTPHLEPSRATMSKFHSHPHTDPVHMINLLKFKKQCEGSNLTGQEMYQKSSDAVAPLLKSVGGRVMWYGKPFAGCPALIGGSDWDAIVIVQYPSKEHFYKMVTSKEYKDINYLRVGSLERMNLIPTERLVANQAKL